MDGHDDEDTHSHDSLLHDEHAEEQRRAAMKQQQQRRAQAQQQQQQQPTQQQPARQQGPGVPRGAPNQQMSAEQIRQARQAHAERLAQLEQEEKELELKYGAEQVLALIVPVSLCMIVVVASVRSVQFFAEQTTQFVYSPYKEDDSESSGERFGGALLNVIIFIGIILVMTCLLVVLYKYRCYKAIHGWLIMSSLLLLFFFSFQYIVQVLEAHNKTLDYITLGIVIWNFGCVGLAVIHWKGPLLLQQVYLIVVSSLMALVLIKNLPTWTTWLLLGAIAVYDLFAVLCPSGPLKMLVETAQERDEPLFPALIYSSTIMYPVIAMGMADTAGSSPPADDADQRDVERFGGRSPQAVSTQQSVNRPPADESAPEEEEENRGVKLGLGDFIFYSVLVGKAATADNWTTILACYVAILIGLAATLLILSILQRALPALPISIFCGLAFFFSTSRLLVPMVELLVVNQVHV